MNGIDNLTLYKTVDELQESKNSMKGIRELFFKKCPTIRFAAGYR